MSDAVKYFQVKGLKASKELVEMGFGFVSLEGDLSFHTEQLKQLVESYDLVEKHGGYEVVKEMIDNPICFGDSNVELEIRLNKAIADVESCLETDKKLEGL
jgi:hypothetical protein